MVTQHPIPYFVLNMVVFMCLPFKERNILFKEAAFFFLVGLADYP
jgi:hypothetical protein